MLVFLFEFASIFPPGPNTLLFVCMDIFIESRSINEHFLLLDLSLNFTLGWKMSLLMAFASINIFMFTLTFQKKMNGSGDFLCGYTATNQSMRMDIFIETRSINKHFLLLDLFLNLTFGWNMSLLMAFASINIFIFALT